MTHARRFQLLALGLGALCACSGRIRDDQSASAPRPSEPAPDAGTSAAPSSTASFENAASRCEHSQPGQPLLRRLTLRQLSNTLADLYPEAASALPAFELNDVSSKLGFSNDADTLVVSPQTAGAVLDAAEKLAAALSSEPALSQRIPCATKPADAACARSLIEQQGKRLFRRPLTAAEIDRYAALFDSTAQAADFATAAKWTWVALIQSPHTLYRRELGDMAADRSDLDGYELASELAYTFNDTTPDEELLQLAERGELAKPEVRLAQARRLLATDRGREGLRQFFREWLHYENVRTADRALASFTDVRSALIDETTRYLDQVVFEDHGGVRELLLSPFTFVSSRLADYYGLPDPPTDFAQTPREPERGIGILAQGSLLASAANTQASSPTQRGLTVLEKLLCRTRPKPPPTVPPLSSSDPASYKTTRQHYEDAHAQGYCQSCHVQFDPIGFAFEHFDQGGRYRAEENGEPIDATGSLRNTDGSVAFDFDGEAALAQGLADSPEVSDCVSGLLVAYAFGGAGSPCLAEDARAGLRSGDYGLVELLARLTSEPHFTSRDPVAAASSSNPTPQPEPEPTATTMAPAPARPAAPDAGTPSPPAREDIGIHAEYQASNGTAHDNVIGPYIQLANLGSNPVALAELHIRYYFTNEHDDLCPDGCRIEGYYAGIHPSGQGVTPERRYVASSLTHAYLDIGFAAGSPQLQPGERVEVQQNFHTNPYLDFDETDDYSFDASHTSFRDQPKITVYRDQTLVWGDPPP